mgnify:CR=1 FL=1
MAKSSKEQSAKSAGSDIDAVRHSLAHLLAAAVLEKFPKTKLGIGPVIENGFYYDFQFPRDATLTPEMLPELEKTMRRLANQHLPFSGKKVTAAEAKKLFKDQPFKVDLVNEYAKDGKTLTIYETGSAPNKTKGTTNYQLQTTNYFLDLCKGGHVKNTSEINPEAFKLTHLAGAYWRGNEKNPQLVRIYALAFATKKELDDHLKLLEEAKKRDHKVLGKQLGLFTFSPIVGSGLPLYLPKGAVIREGILDYITKLKRQRNYQFVWTPHLAKEELYIKSGHLGKYDAMLPAIRTDDGERLVIKPMNCPHHFQLYLAEPKSYRDLPFRIAENATDYRNEKSGELNGLFRVRSLTQDDTHHIVRHDQIANEIDMILGLTREVYETFGFKNFHVEISTWDPKLPKKYFGGPKLWKDAQDALVAAAKRWGAPYKIVEGEAAFYGPKIDIRVEDALGRNWQLTTVQLDYNQPENFDLSYTGEDGKPTRPAVIHAAILGSVDRFMGIVIEHFAGAFPAWLAPVQAVVVPVGEKVDAYGKKVFRELIAAGIRAEYAEPTETLGKRIRNAEMQKVPYILVVGEKEEQAKSVNVRERGEERKNTEMKTPVLVEKIRKEIVERI